MRQHLRVTGLFKKQLKVEGARIYEEIEGQAGRFLMSM